MAAGSQLPSCSPSILPISISIFISAAAVFLIAPRFLPPKTLPSIPLSDDLDDLALFRRATLSSYSPSGKDDYTKIAFLFLTNSDLHFLPLWEKFFRKGQGYNATATPLFNVYVHADPAAVGVDRVPEDSFFHGRFIPNAKSTRRASPTLISAARRLLAIALLHDPRNAFFALVSQRCVPLHSLDFVRRTLFDQSPRRSFVEILTESGSLFKRYVARGDQVMLPEVPFRNFRVGSQFFVLARKHALMVVQDRVLWRKFRLPCLKSREDSCYPEEHYFPTLLDMREKDRRLCSRFTLTNVNWTGSFNGHPYMYGPEEVSEELIRKLRVGSNGTSYLFARKFSPDCLGPLMDIADSVIFNDG